MRPSLETARSVGVMQAERKKVLATSNPFTSILRGLVSATS